MSYIGQRARLLILGLAVVLLLPAVGILGQRESELESFHNRRLSAWPAIGIFLADPVRYFQGMRAWLSDRVYPVQQVTHLQKRLVFHWLQGAPEPRVTLGSDGHIFLNGGSNREVNKLLNNACLRAHTDKNAKALQHQLAQWKATAAAHHLAIDVVVVPTAASLYAHKLPRSTPAPLRRACGQRMAGRSPLLDLRAPDGVHFVYPLREMLAQRDDEAFFPRGNWHPTGLSLKVVRDAYLARLGVTTAVDETLTRGEAPAEILLPYGIEQPEPTYFIHNPSLRPDPELDARVRREIARSFRGNRFVTHAFSNQKPVLAQSAVMLSDSYGDLASETFAGAFRQLIHINANDMRGRALGVLDTIARITPVDRLILLVQEAGTRRIKRWNR